MNHKLPFWIQGFDINGNFTGDYESINFPPASFLDILKIIEKMPKMVEDDDDSCPPQIGFPDGKFCLSRDTLGSFYLYPHEVGLELEEVPMYLKEYWEKTK